MSSEDAKPKEETPVTFPTFTFTMPTAQPFMSAQGPSELSTTGAEDAAGGDDEDQDAVEAEREAAVEFQPIVHLEKQEMKTNEEDEEELYCHRAKLYRFDVPNKEWKERGLGDVRLMRHKTTKMVRILMRREKVLKVCLNHCPVPEFSLSPALGSDRAWTWNCPLDYTEDPPTHEIFAIKFGTPEVALEFREAFERAQEENGKLIGKKKEEEEEEEK